jgi:protein-S-isoprenylcysteine O-methyltransferase Ste14
VSPEWAATHLVKPFIRALLFGLALVYLSVRVFSSVVRPETVGVVQFAGLAISATGVAIALWCVFSFARIGRGTPAPFAAPRRLVTQGPYRFVRNPMYIGVGLGLAGAALMDESLALFGYVVLFFVASHLFIVWYEEPTLHRLFGRAYASYCAQVRRWRPRV